MQKTLTDIDLGTNIKKIRENKRMSQAGVVQELHLKGRMMSVSHYGRIEQGRKISMAGPCITRRDFGCVL